MRLIFRAPQQPGRAAAGEERAEREEGQVAGDEGQAGVAEIDNPKRVAEMRERKGLREEADRRAKCLSKELK